MSSSAPPTTLPSLPESEPPLDALDPSDSPPSATTTATIAPNSTSTSQPSQPPSATTDPFSALSSMWSVWLAPSVQAPQTTTTTTSSTNSASDNANNTTSATTATSSTSTTSNPSTTNPAADLLSGAGKMWNDLGATLKDAATNVDTAALLGDQVSVIRQQSGRFMEDVSRSVQQLNISLPSTEDLDLTRSAAAITSSTKELLDKASQSLEKGRKEALEIFVDADSDAVAQRSSSNGNSTLGSANGVDPSSSHDTVTSGGSTSIAGDTTTGGFAPWDAAALPGGEKQHADVLRTEMLKLVVDAIYSRKKRTSLFLSDVARKRGFQFDLERRAREAMAALEADKNMRRLRAGLVPGKMKEEVFWQTYFYHVHRIRQTLVANQGVMPETGPEEEEDEDDLFADEHDNDHEQSTGNNGEAAVPGKTDAGADTQQGTAAGAGEKVKSPAETGKVGGPSAADADKKEGERDWEEDIEAAFKDDDE